MKLGISRLSDAVSWSEASQEFEAASLVQSRALGRQWKGRKTDWDAFERSFATAEEVIALAPSDVTDRTVAFFTTEIPEPAHYEVAVGAREALHAWRQYLAQPPNGGGHPELVVEPIETSLMWISAHLAPMEQALSLVTEVNAVNGRNHLLSEAEAILLASEAAHRAAGEARGRGAATHETVPRSVPRRRHGSRRGGHCAFMGAQGSRTRPRRYPLRAAGR